MLVAALNSIEPAKLLRRIGLPDAPVIVDIRLEDDFEADPWLIPGAIRASHSDLPRLEDRLGDTPGVIACQKGLKLSQGVTAWLRAQGRVADYLDGGTMAWAALPDAPQLPVAALPDQTLWVTPHGPKIDRIACPWLIRRFINAQARFLFVAPAEVQAVADRFDAVPFDCPGVVLSHDNGGCTFDTMLDRFGLRTQALDRVAGIIRAADTNQLDSAPEAAGLRAISLGLSRQYRDDTAQLNAGLAIYDALYRWARDGHEADHTCMESPVA